MTTNARHARHEIRQANLLLLIEEAGSQATFCALTDSEKTHVSALTKGRRNVGDQLAQRFEARFGKPPGWMDEDHSGSGAAGGDPLPLGIAQLMAHAPAERRQAFYDAIRLTVLQAREKFPPARIGATLDYIDRMQREAEAPPPSTGDMSA